KTIFSPILMRTFIMFASNCQDFSFGIVLVPFFVFGLMETISLCNPRIINAKLKKQITKYQNVSPTIKKISFTLKGTSKPTDSNVLLIVGDIIRLQTNSVKKPASTNVFSFSFVNLYS